MGESVTKQRLELEEVLEVDIAKVIEIEILDIDIRASSTVKWRIIPESSFRFANFKGCDIR